MRRLSPNKSPPTSESTSDEIYGADRPDNTSTVVGSFDFSFFSPARRCRTSSAETQVIQFCACERQQPLWHRTQRADLVIINMMGIMLSTHCSVLSVRAPKREMWSVQYIQYLGRSSSRGSAEGLVNARVRTKLKWVWCAAGLCPSCLCVPVPLMQEGARKYVEGGEAMCR